MVRKIKGSDQDQVVEVEKLKKGRALCVFKGHIETGIGKSSCFPG